MHCGRRCSIVIVFTLLACLGPAASFVDAQQPPAIELVFPHQLVRGQTNVLNIAVPSREAFRGAEISPAAGVTVSAVENAKKAELSQGVAWWRVTVDVARDAEPGTRTLTLLTAAGRTAPVALTVPSHVPAISNLTVMPARSGQPTIDLQFAAADQSSDLGETPYVWFTIGCGGEPTVGVVRGKVAAGVVRAALPNPRAASSAPPAGRCDLEVRASDSAGIDSNTLKAAVDRAN